ncbi:50S ribosomal protein L6 [Candidatus Woesearchaeota archaeon]|nr:50S ribosomal protein L6 [Candidatus Woesearchaeota archaeon]
MKIKELKKEIETPEGVEVKLADKTLFVKGPRGENSRRFQYPRLELLQRDNKIFLLGRNATKKDKTMIGTYSAHIKNLLAGVKNGFDYKLKVCSGHFPMTVAVERNKVVISNFMGEKVPRNAKIFPGVDVKVEGDTITVSGLDRERVGQTAANIELATRRPGFDKRIFQDGCYIISKADKEIK